MKDINPKLSFEDRHRLEERLLPWVIDEPKQAAQQILVYENTVEKLRNLLYRCVQDVERSDSCWDEAADLLNMEVPE